MSNLRPIICPLELEKNVTLFEKESLKTDSQSEVSMHLQRSATRWQRFGISGFLCDGVGRKKMSHKMPPEKKC